MVYAINNSFSDAIDYRRMQLRRALCQRGRCQRIDRYPHKDWVEIRTSKGEKIKLHPEKYGHWPLQGIINKARAHEAVNRHIEYLSNKMYG